ncbi:MAG: hypothetical protein HZA51_18085 [Planctomycetes bacterium]|nr:hypothetical protein [Planctomycetota bacterium]
MRKYEHRSEPLIPSTRFLLRLARSGSLAVMLIGASLLLGVLGYHSFEGMPWIDSLLNASMILGGMGPVDSLHTERGKLFASFYALFSGIMFLTVAAILFAPAVHRLLHKFHLDNEEK